MGALRLYGVRTGGGSVNTYFSCNPGASPAGHVGAFVVRTMARDRTILGGGVSLAMVEPKMAMGMVVI